MEELRLSLQDLIQRIASLYSIEDVLYILGKDTEWLLYRIKTELLEHKEEFISGDDYYTRIDE
jgi:hypothetical protein